MEGVPIELVTSWIVGLIAQFIVSSTGSSSTSRSVDRAAAGSVIGVTVYALNLFDIAGRDEYLAYSERSPQEVAKHGGRVVALGQFSESCPATSRRARC